MNPSMSDASLSILTIRPAIAIAIAPAPTTATAMEYQSEILIPPTEHPCL